MASCERTDPYEVACFLRDAHERADWDDDRLVADLLYRGLGNVRHTPDEGFRIAAGPRDWTILHGGRPVQAATLDEEGRRRVEAVLRTVADIVTWQAWEDIETLAAARGMTTKPDLQSIRERALLEREARTGWIIDGKAIAVEHGFDREGRPTTTIDGIDSGRLDMGPEIDDHARRWRNAWATETLAALKGDERIAGLERRLREVPERALLGRLPRIHQESGNRR